MQGSINFDGTLSGSIAGGGGGGGSEVSITPVVTEGTKIADYSIDGTAGELYAPEAGDTVEVTPTLNVGDKVADIKVNGVNKALYSQSYGYANDMHDTNSETIGGLQKGSNITPIMVKAVSYADQSGVDGETIGVLSVGDTDYAVKQKKANVINYSTTEQDTGKKWVDGKSIYQKTYININLSNNQDIVLDANVSTMQLLSYVIDFCGIPNTLTKHIENTSDTLYIDNRGLIYYINRTTSWWNELDKANITVYYTKSED